MHTKLMLRALIFLVLSGGAALGEDTITNASIVAEAEIQDKGDISRLSVFLVNKSTERRTLFTGRVGTSATGKFDPVDLDQVAKDASFGNGILAVPEFTFGALTFSAPTTVGHGITFRSMRPTLVELPKDVRLLYCTFSVPSVHVQSPFVSGRIRFPALSKRASEQEVAITKCERKK